MNRRKFDGVVVGNGGIDTKAYIRGSDIDFSVESNFTENLYYVGQAGGYASRGFAQLRKRTAFIGYVGDDYSCRFIREESACDGIDTTALFIDPSGTSRSINFNHTGTARALFSGLVFVRPERALQVIRLGEKSNFHQ